MTTEIQKPLRVFCSYSRRDEEHLNNLRGWLRGLERQGLIEWWHDREIVPGWEWEEAIDKHLRTADIVLLLVSTDFMASDYVYEQEIGKAIEKHDRGEARVIPIIVRPSYWEWASFGKLQALPKDARPITRWEDRDEAWLDVLEGVRKAVKELLVERQERAAKERYHKAVEEAWTDNNVSDAEAERLGALASELGLSTEAAAGVEGDIMGAAKEVILKRQEQAARERAREEQLKGLFGRARALHHDQKWQSVINIFDQIHSEDPAYPDPEGLLASAREALEAQERAQRVASMYDQGLRHMDAEEWQQALKRFEEVLRLEPGYRDTERRLSQVREELGRRLPITAALASSRGGQVRTLKGHKKSVNTVAFSPDGQLLASGSGGMFGGDNTVRLWQVENGELLRTQGHPIRVESVAFSPDGELLASGAQDRTVRLWWVENGELLRTMEWHEDSSGVWSVAFSPDGELLASTVDKAVHLWRVENGELLRTMEWHEGIGVWSVAFSPDGELLAAAGDKAVRLWSIKNGELQRTLVHERFAKSVAISPDGKLLASVATSIGSTYPVWLWSVENGELVSTLERSIMEGPSTGITSVAFSPDGELLATASYLYVWLWSVKNGELRRTPVEHKKSVSSVAFSPDGSLLASGSEDKTVRLWGA